MVAGVAQTAAAVAAVVPPEGCVGFFECLGRGIASEMFRNLSFLGGVAVAVVSVVSARSTARKKQAADMLLSSRCDKELMAGLRKLAKLHEDANVNLRKFAKQDEVDSEEAQSIRYILNHWEYVSVGIQSGIYDEGMIKEASWGTVTKLYERAKPFIEQVRLECNRHTIYQEFQWLAKRWEGSPLKSKKRKKS